MFSLASEYASPEHSLQTEMEHDAFSLKFPFSFPNIVRILTKSFCAEVQSTGLGSVCLPRSRPAVALLWRQLWDSGPSGVLGGPRVSSEGLAAVSLPEQV